MINHNGKEYFKKNICVCTYKTESLCYKTGVNNIVNQLLGHACEVTSVVSDSVILWTVTCKAPLSKGFSRQEYWSGLPCPSPGNFPGPGIEPVSPMFPELAGRFYH